MCTAVGLIEGDDVTYGTLRCEQDFFKTGLYVGEMAGAVPHGGGTMAWENGWTYTGDWRSGSRHGRGELIGGLSIYRGDFADDRFNGQGTEITTDGQTYTGTFVDGSRSGPGVLTWAVGSSSQEPLTGAVRLEGEFSMQGATRGVLTWADGRTFEGTFEGLSPMPVQGTLTDAEGARYVEFDRDRWEFVEVAPPPPPAPTPPPPCGG
ncbi:hypothetical protein [Rubrivirga sp.]|uniref:hypothetical protein n=1 Tax=Rubrivirga sp. TaxID=1885344 RepID=UPI003C7570C9